MKPIFSVVLIVKNEEKTLPRLIRSLAEFVKLKGEIIILDTGSTDNTVKIARSLKCRVYSVGDKYVTSLSRKLAQDINKRFIISPDDSIVRFEDRLFDYSAARNYAASLASNDWIFMPDADEVLTKFDIRSIEKALLQCDQLEYNFVFAHDENDKPLVQFLHSKFYRKSKLKWTGIIHEILSGSANRHYLPPDVILLEHYQNHETNRKHYLTGLAYDCYTNPTNDRNTHYFARELMYSGRYHSAIKMFEHHIGMNAWLTEATQSMIYIGDCYMSLNQPAKAMEYFMLSFDREPNRREALMRIAEFYRRNNQPRQTIAFALAATTIPTGNFYSNFQPYYEELPHELLSWGYRLTGDKIKSEFHLEEYYKYKPRPKTLVEVLTHKIRSGVNFTFVKRGDGEINCMAGIKGHNCDGDHYNEKLGSRLRQAFKFLSKHKSVVLTDISNQKDINCLLHRTDSDPGKVRDFYIAVKESKRRKIYVAPERLSQVSEFLGAEHIVVPETNAFSKLDTILKKLPSEDCIYLFSAGMTSKVIIAELVKKGSNLTCIDVGSAWDSLISPTRTFQLPKRELEDLYGMNSYPLVSIIIPTLGREQGLSDCLNSINNLDYPEDKIEVIVIEDKPRRGVPRRVHEGLAASTGEFIVFGANDMVFEADCLKRALIDYRRTGKRLISFNEGPLLPDEGNICTHFMIKRDLIPLIGGKIFDTDFHHVGVDNLLWSKCMKLNEAFHSTNARITHNHFSKTGKMDDIYELGWKNVKKDRSTLKKKLSLI